MAWIKGFCCRGCGSTLGRWGYNPHTLTKEVLCFVCGVGIYELLLSETEGEDNEVVMQLKGRESGQASEILPRLNTPGYIASTMRSSENIKDALGITPSIHFSHESYAGLSPEMVQAIENLAIIASRHGYSLKRRSKKVPGKTKQGH